MGEMVTYPSNGHTASGYLAYPASGTGPGVVVIQEWWGLVPHIKDIADRFAAEGYLALAPDLYHGEQTTEPNEAGKMMMELDIARAEQDLRGAIEYVRMHPLCEARRVGTVGFCMGGQLSLYAASKNPQLNAAVVFYGIHPNFKADIEAIQAPILGIFAEKDDFTPPDKARELEQALRAAGKEVEAHMYAGTDHAFFNDQRPEVYNAEASKDAWAKTLAFLDKHLR